MKYCPHCGVKVEESTKFCSECGQKLTVTERRPMEQESKIVRTGINTTELGEVTHYKDSEGVRVTDSRLIVYGTTYVIANITSVRTSIVEGDRIPGAMIASVGFICFVASVIAPVVPGIPIGLLLMAGGIFWAVKSTDAWELIITTSAGEKTLLSSKDIRYINDVKNAINDVLSKPR